MVKTINDIYLEARKRLRSADVDAHDLEARLIVSCASGKQRHDFALFDTDGSISTAVDALLNRRLDGEPVAYIVGEWEFYSLPIDVDNSVLIPRVDTEVLAESAISLSKRFAGRCRLLDLCAGSGCVGLAVAANVRNSRVILADNSQNALKLCRANVLKNKLTRNVTVIDADALESPPQLLRGFDVIVANPPYIPSDEIFELPPSVRDYEPWEALDGGDDGLEFYRAIAAKWKVALTESGYLLLECGVGQAQSVREILKKNGFGNISVISDTIGVERVISARRVS